MVVVMVRIVAMVIGLWACSLLGVVVIDHGFCCWVVVRLGSSSWSW